MAAIYEALSKLYGDEKHADLTVTCAEQTFNLHRLVVFTQSPFFERACSGRFKEAFTGHIDLSEGDPEIFAKFVQFIYTGNYADEDHLDPDGCDEAVLNSTDDLLLSLTQGTDMPGPDLYHSAAWAEEFYNTSPHCEKCKNCGRQVCSGEDCGSEKVCGYKRDSERYRCFYEQDMSDSGEEYEDDDMDGDVALDDLVRRQFVGDWYQLPYPDGDGYQTDLPHAMFTSLRVYCLADMFGVPALQVLARNRFYRAVERNISSSGFVEVVDEVFETTAPDDWALKGICVLLIGAQCLSEKRDQRLVAALEPVFCKHRDLVERLEALPGMKLRHTGEGWVPCDGLKDQEEVDRNEDMELDSVVGDEDAGEDNARAA